MELRLVNDSLDATTLEPVHRPILRLRVIWTASYYEPSNESSSSL